MGLDDVSGLLARLGLDGTLKQVAANPALGAAIAQCFTASGLTDSSLDKSSAALLCAVASGLADAARAHRRNIISSYVGDGRLTTAVQIAAAVEFFKKLRPDADFSPGDFESACGAGISFSDAQVADKAKQVVDLHREAIIEQRFMFGIGPLMNAFREGEWRWADGAKVKSSLDAAFAAVVGPRTSDDDSREAALKEARKAANKAKNKDDKAAAAASTPEVVAAPRDDVFVARELAAAVNSPELIAQHKAATGGKIRTRFPPEPNGFLHIGHAKSMNLNFEGAFRALGIDPATGGDTTFRYDDTNPAAEAPEYIESQAENVAWMGWRPARVTHSSDYFPQLYDFAVELIKRGKAYVCHQTKEDMEASREIARARDGRSAESPWRNRPVEESLREFEAMKFGKYKEGAAVLRLKIDMTSVNPTLWDPVAYRIKFVPHPLTGDKWCIYPAYDYSHPIIDSLENIDYSLCTLEFEVRRDLYYWTLEALNLYRPTVYEFSRLNINRNVLSKRRILKLVTDGRVRGWDDPRLLTVNGLRRRGYSAAGINAFCRDIGVTRNDNTVTLSNVPEDFHEVVEAPDFPRDKSLGSHTVHLTRVLFIERDDFREVDDPDYFGLAPGKSAGLRYSGMVTVDGVERGADGNVTGLLATYDATRSGGRAKLKGNLHWVSGSTPGSLPTEAEVRLYDHLFTVDEPGAGGADWEAELNTASETVLTGCYVDASLVDSTRVKKLDHFQFERQGYFVVDLDSDVSSGKLVFNQTVSLKEDSSAKKLKGAK